MFFVGYIKVKPVEQIKKGTFSLPLLLLRAQQNNAQVIGKMLARNVTMWPIVYVFAVSMAKKDKTSMTVDNIQSNLIAIFKGHAKIKCVLTCIGSGTQFLRPQPVYKFKWTNHTYGNCHPPQTNGIDFLVVSFKSFSSCVQNRFLVLYFIYELSTPHDRFYVLVVFWLICAENVLECLNVTCHNRIGSHPYRRLNTCYIKWFDRPLQNGEQLAFLQSYGLPEKIKTLDLTMGFGDLGIDHIPVEAFSWFTNLESLRVNSKVASISASDLEQAHNLTELVISDQLQLLERGIFPSNNRLTFLSFESNRINEIEDFAFEQLNRLFSLKLQKNHLETIRKDTFSGLGNLHVLNLNQNRIRVIQNGAFEGLNKLQFLHLQQNQIENLYDGVFYGLTNLIDISLSKNRIHHINKSLQILTEIKKIDLDYNQILDLNVNVFTNFRSLVDLRLISSGFNFKNTKNEENERVEDENPRPTSMLEYLYLDNNNLSNPLDLQVLSVFSELKELSLDDNLYEHFNLNGKRIKEIWPKLRYLSLEGNDIDPSVLSSIKDELNPQMATINPI